jgi:hypothetical protein
MNKAAREELDFIRNQHGGLLKPTDVLEYARNDQTALHKFFEWDDTEAAAKYRLQQARAIIRVVVQIIPSTDEKIRAFVSLSSDRHNGNGYRVITDVMDDEALTEILLQDAKNELAAFSRKYQKLERLSNMADVFKAINKVVQPEKTAEQETRLSA